VEPRNFKDVSLLPYKCYPDKGQISSKIFTDFLKGSSAKTKAAGEKRNQSL
jgi:hypothetical protein